MAYCHWCHRWSELGPAAMCVPCRRDWAASSHPSGDPLCHIQSRPVQPSR